MNPPNLLTITIEEAQVPFTFVIYPKLNTTCAVNIVDENGIRAPVLTINADIEPDLPD